MKKTSLYALGMATAVAAAGCGGAGSDGMAGLNLGGGTPNAAKAASKVNTFLTSANNTRFSHAWVKVVAIDLVNSTTSARIFTNTSGKVVDLATMQDAAGLKFAFLGTAGIPAG